MCSVCLMTVKYCIKTALAMIPCSPVTVFSPQQMYGHDDVSFVYGRRGTRLSPTLAAFVNGVAVSINRWNRCVTIVPSTPDNFRRTKSITTTKLWLFYTQLQYSLGRQLQEGLVKILN